MAEIDAGVVIKVDNVNNEKEIGEILNLIMLCYHLLFDNMILGGDIWLLSFF